MQLPTRDAPLFCAGRVAILGRPNVGKSTLVNALLQTKLAAVSPRPQTTRYRLLGVLHGDGFQIGLLDTPGWPARARSDQLAQRMVREIMDALEEGDLALLLVEPRPPGDVERRLLEEIERRAIPALVAVNKIDMVRKPALLPVIEAYAALAPVREVVPISALQEDGLEVLLRRLVSHLPEREPLFPPDALTDRTERFIVAELIREKVFALYHEEVPYATAVRVEEFREASDEHAGKGYIAATIYVERPSQQAILVGQGGLALKEVGVSAREEIEAALGRPFYLALQVKTQPRWRRDPLFLRSLEQQ